MQCICGVGLRYLVGWYDMNRAVYWALSLWVRNYKRSVLSLTEVVYNKFIGWINKFSKRYNYDIFVRLGNLCIRKVRCVLWG